MNADSDIEKRLEEEAVKEAAQAAKEKDAKRITDQIIRSVGSLFMLSVNARIEAASSGEAGRGFAVVADEIGRLAKQNEQLARNILKVVD